VFVLLLISNAGTVLVLYSAQYEAYIRTESNAIGERYAVAQRAERAQLVVVSDVRRP
jgi:hypothetical protein